MAYFNKSFLKMCLGFGFLIVIGSALFIIMAREDKNDTGLPSMVQSQANTDLTVE